jgi:hypothetical protein
MHCHHYEKIHSRRDFLTKLGMGLGAMSLSSLINPLGASTMRVPGLKGLVPRAKRVIYLFQSGGPSQQDMFDYKPMLRKMHGQELPESIRLGQRLTGMTAGQGSLPLAGSVFDFKNTDSRASGFPTGCPTSLR